MNQVAAESDEGKHSILLRRLHARLVERDAAISVAHDRNPRAFGPRVKGFVQAQSRMRDLTPIPSAECRAPSAECRTIEEKGLTA